MTETYEAVSRRMKTLQSIHGIVRTMKTLSAVNATPYERAANAIETYHAAILEGFQIFAHSVPGFQVPLAGSNVLKVAVIFGSDHGLCGGYNEAVANAALADIGSPNGRILAVGSRMEDALTGLGYPPDEAFTPPASADGVGRLAGEILVALDRQRTNTPGHELHVTMVYMQREDRGLQSPVINTLLPLEPNLLIDLKKRPWISRSLPVLTMAPAAIFAALIRNHLFASLFSATAEAMVTENAARLALMQQAERAVGERYDQMLATLRSVRQSEITNELLDVIVGFEALKHGASHH